MYVSYKLQCIVAKFRYDHAMIDDDYDDYEYRTLCTVRVDCALFFADILPTQSVTKEPRIDNRHADMTPQSTDHCAMCDCHSTPIHAIKIY